MAQFTFVPAAGAILADWGAEVIKVEHAERGDGQRGLTTVLGVDAIMKGSRFSPIFEGPNRGKRSVGLALEVPEARALLDELIKRSDVFLTNFLPEARAKLRTIPGVGPVTIDVIVSELGDVGRFRSAKAVCAYAGLVPGVRQSSDRRKDLPITKAGSPILRWALVEAAWRAVRHSAAWQRVYAGIRQRAGAKKAIVAVARRLLCVLYALLRDGTNYDFLKVGSHQPT